MTPEQRRRVAKLRTLLGGRLPEGLDERGARILLQHLEWRATLPVGEKRAAWLRELCKYHDASG